MPFQFRKTFIKDLIIIEALSFKDSRGFFTETYKKSEFVKAGINEDFVQDNHSCSSKNVLRGLHFQKEQKAQGKLVRVVKGSVIDVAVDLRKNSETYLKYLAIELNDKNNLMFYIPKGFAHGFLSMEDDTHLVYKCTDEYDAEADAGIRWDDPVIDIDWKIKNPLVSEKDQKLPLLKEIESGL